MFVEHSPENKYKFGKRIGLDKENICKSQMGRDEVSGEVSFPCWHAASVADTLWKELMSFFFGGGVANRIMSF